MKNRSAVYGLMRVLIFIGLWMMFFWTGSKNIMAAEVTDDHSEDVKTVEVTSPDAGNSSSKNIAPILSMDKSYEFTGDLGLIPVLDITMEGLKVSVKDNNPTEYEVFSSENKIGSVEIRYTKAEDMEAYAKALSSEMADPEKEMPDEISALEIPNAFDEDAGEYAAVCVFEADPEYSGEYSDCVGEPAYFEIVPAKLKVHAGKRVETKKYQSVSDVVDDVFWKTCTCERINIEVSEELEDRYLDIENITTGIKDLTCVVDGVSRKQDERFTTCGSYTFQLGGTLTIADEYKDKYVIDTYDFPVNPLVVYSDAELDFAFKEHRHCYYGAPADELASLFNYSYTPGADASDIDPDSYRLEIGKIDPSEALINREKIFDVIYSEAEIPFIQAGYVYCRVIGTNKAGEDVASQTRLMEISKRPVKASSDGITVDRADPAKAVSDRFPYKKKFGFTETGFRFSPVEAFTDISGSDPWSLSYAADALKISDIASKDIFEIDAFGLPYYYYEPGIYEVGSNIDFKPAEFYDKNLYLDEVDLTYTILPKYYYSYMVGNAVICEGETPAGEIGKPVTYAAECTGEISIPEGYKITGWRFYSEDLTESVSDDKGRKKVSYEEGIGGNCEFTDTDVVIKAVLVLVDQGLEISVIDPVTYDGRNHVIPGMKADGVKTVDDLEFAIYEGDYRLVYGEDYTAKVFNGMNASVGLKAPLTAGKLPRVEISGKGDYAGFYKVIYFDILPQDISDFAYVMSPGYIYPDKGGKVHVGKRSITGTLRNGRQVTLKASDYTETNTGVPTKIPKDDYLDGEYTFTATGQGNYTGTVMVTVKTVLYPVQFSSFKFKYDKKIAYKENLTPADFNVSVFTPKGRILDRDEYDLYFEGIDEDDLVNPGSGVYKIHIEPSDSIVYGTDETEVIGSKVISVTVMGEKLNKNAFKLSWTAAPYDGTDKANAVTCIKGGLTEGRDYTCEWEDGCDQANKAVGNYTVKIRGIGKYANLDKNGQPACIKLTFKRTLCKVAKAGNVAVSIDQESAAPGTASANISVIVKNADESETVYMNHKKGEGWSRVLTDSDGNAGFAVTSWAKDKKTGQITAKLKALPDSGFSGVLK